jgi:tetratricopeptide (TPR) repeat protein
MTKVALLIGVSEYESELKPLPGSVKDVDAMKRVLADPRMGDFSEADITVLKNPQRQEMEDAIYWLFADRKKDDLVLFYFSGHGIKDENGKLYFATRATRKENGKLVRPSAVAAAVLRESINECRSQHQVIILDSCFSGAIAERMTIKDDGTVNLQEQLGGRGRAILTSSSSTEYSFGSDVHEDSGLSVYTRFLVEGIETGAADIGGNGLITVDELHEYASDRVKKAAPAMTPKFYPVEEGYKILIAKSPRYDPRLRYRKEVQQRAEQGRGKLSYFAQKLLEDERIEWGLSAEEAKTIEDAVLQPFREYEQKLQKYEQELIQAANIEYPFSDAARADLKDYQKHLKLRDSDIAVIEERVFAPLRAEYERQQQEAKRLKQEQEQAEYENKLQCYRQDFERAVRAEYPLSQVVLQGLRTYQQQLGLKDEDVERIEQPIQELFEAKYQENQKQQREADQRRQAELELRRRAEHEDKLQCYRQEFSRAVQAEYPLNEYVLGGLKRFQLQLGLNDEDVAQIERPIREPLEARYREQLKQQDLAEKQRQLELRQKTQEERFTQEASETGNQAEPNVEDMRQRVMELQQVLKQLKQEPESNTVAPKNLDHPSKIQSKPATTVQSPDTVPTHNDTCDHRNLGFALQEQGRLDEAIVELRKVVQLNPDDGEALLTLVYSLCEQGKWEEGIAEYRKGCQGVFLPFLDSLKEWAEDLRRSDENNDFALCLSLYFEGKWEESVAELGGLFYQNVTRNTPPEQWKQIEAESRLAIQSNLNDEESHFTLGLSLHLQGELEEAIQEYREAIQINPDSTARCLLVSAFSDQGKLNKAILELTIVLSTLFKEMSSNIDEGLLLATLMYYLQTHGKLDIAIIGFRSILETIESEFTDLIHCCLAIALYDQGKLEEAIAELQPIIQQNKAKRYYSRGVNFYDQGKLDLAIVEFRMAIQLNPNNAESHTMLATALHDQGKLDEAIQEYREAIQINPSLADVHYKLGESLRDQNKQNEAIVEFQKAIQIDPNHTEAYVSLGGALYSQGNLDAAIKEYHKAIQINPNHEFVYLMLAFALQDQGKKDEAYAAYQKAVQINPSLAEAHGKSDSNSASQSKTKEITGVHQKAEQAGSKRKKLLGIF